jgi:hypothetical protein
MKLVQAVTTIVVIACLGLVFLIWRFESPPFDLTKLEKLHKGMAPQEVREILGEPSDMAPASWHYTRWGSWPIVTVYFDGDGRLESHEYDY